MNEPSIHLSTSRPDGRRSRAVPAASRLRLTAGIALLVLLLLATGCSGRRTPTPTPAPPDEPPPALPAPGVTALPEAQETAVATPTPEVSQVPAEPPATGQPNRIVIPKIDLDAPIIDVGWKVVERDGERFTEWETADNAAGRHINSARPGQQGNVVLSGHHNTKGEVFRRISELELAPGDAIYLYDGQGQRFTYQVDQVTDPPLQEVGATPDQRLENARYIQPTSDARVTLVTCWPYVTNTHRVVVVGKLVP